MESVWEDVLVNWEAAGATGEIAGAIAVVITLIYLAKQVRDNSKHVMLNTTQAFASLAQDAFAPIYNNADTIRIWLVGSSEPESLTEIELKTFYLFMDRLCNNIEPLFAQFKGGTVTKSEFDRYVSWYREILTTNGGRQWVEQRKFMFSDEVANVISVRSSG